MTNTETPTRLDQFVFNLRALGCPWSREEANEAASLIRLAIRMGIAPLNETETLLFAIVNDIWGDLL